MSCTVIPNSAVLAGEGATPAHDAYRRMIDALPHDEWCDAYGLDRDGVDGGTYWEAVLSAAIHWGDIDPTTLELT